jgi:hypothetical protein
MKNFVSVFSMLLLICLTNFGVAKPKIEEFGEVNIPIKTQFTVVEQSQAINYFDSGTVTIGSANAMVESCIEKVVYRKKSTKVDLRCYIVMDDQSPGIMEYVAILNGDEELSKNFDKGVSIFPPKNGLKYWQGHFEFKTSSEKYSWINDQTYLGKGVELRGPNSKKGGLAKYKLYKLQN